MTTFFCPHCKRAQVVGEHFDGTNDVVHCIICGHPIEKATGKQPSARQAKLLFIDDNELILGLLRSFALAHGFLPRLATDAPAGIALAKRERPDLIILDVTSPRVFGLEVCRRLRAEPDLQHVPILLITALEDPTIFAKGLEAGATLTVAKILTPHRFLLTIKMLLSPTLSRPNTC